jgi:hypothetical protein
MKVKTHVAAGLTVSISASASASSSAVLTGPGSISQFSSQSVAVHYP